MNESFDSLRSAGLAEIDAETARLLARELERQRGQIELIASENFTWPSVLEAIGSVPTNKYAEGYPGKRYIAAKAVCFKIAATEAFRCYQRQVRLNANALAEELIAGGLDVLTGGTDTHLLQLDLRRSAWSGKDAEERLGEVLITVNRNTVPFDERPPTVASGVRLGTPAATMRRFDEQDFREVGQIITSALRADADLGALASQSAELCRKRPLYPGFTGHTLVAQAVLGA